jgi:SAM-dependent methyltransferase
MLSSNRELYSYRGSNVRALCDLYESTTFERVHRSWLAHLPKRPGAMLDVGAGSGRDAAALQIKGWRVVAVDCSRDMLDEAKRRHPDATIRWLHDRLPQLTKLRGERFDLILCSAVWMHLDPTERVAGMRMIHDLLAEKGICVFTLRHPPDVSRGMSEVTISETTDLAQRNSLVVLQATQSGDPIPEWHRPDISWSTIVIQRNSKKWSTD